MLTAFCAGKVTAQKKGTAKITAKYKGKKYTCKITVKKKSAAKTSAAPGTQAPGTPASAAPSGQPGTSSQPGGSSAPGESTAPGESSAPGESTAPSESSAPGESTAPDESAAPTESTAPGESSAPSETPAADALQVESVTVATASKIKVNFNKAIDAASAIADNFSLSGNATVVGTQLSEDAKTVTLSTNGLVAGTEYTLTIKGITAGIETLADYETTFKAKEMVIDLKLESTTLKADESGKLVMKADGNTTTVIKTSIIDEEGNVIEDADEISLSYSTTSGNFASSSVTVQKGVAENTLTAPSLITAEEALITVTVTSAPSNMANLKNTQKQMKITMDPNPNMGGDEDESVGASLTDIKVQTADRVALFFNKKVNVTDYTENNKQGDWNILGYDDTKMAITVTQQLDDGAPIQYNVYALTQVPGNDQALYAHLGIANWTYKYLTPLADNAEVTVKAVDKTKNIPVESTKKASLQDVKNPTVLGVSNDGLNKIVVTFDEAVNPAITASELTADEGYMSATQQGNRVWNLSTTGRASDIAHYVLDGRPLNNTVWGVPTDKAVAAPGMVNVWNQTDTTNVVTITLGKDGNGKQIYLTPGKHSLQITGVGDAANASDDKNNLLETKTLDFMVAEDNSKVEASVKVQSPEQYIVTLNKVVDGAEAILQANMELQSKKADGTFEKVGDYLDVKAIGNDNKTFRVELKTDWTKLLDTKETKKNYFNNTYRLFIPKDKLENTGNGKLNDDIAMNLDDKIMTEPDVTSPEITDVQDNGDGTYTIFLSEPVKISGQGMYMTPNQDQNTDSGVPIPTIEFIKGDNSETISATIEGVGDEHTTIKVKPASGLAAGIWKVVVKSISDDVGNTAATLVKPDFEQKTEVQSTTFEVLWIVAVPSGADDLVVDPTGSTQATNDMIYVKFNQDIATTGSTENVVNPSNYLVNTYTIPVKTKIDVDIAGYNDEVSQVYGVSGRKDTIAITLDSNNSVSLGTTSNQISIGTNLKSAKGDKIGNGGLKTLKKNSGIFTWNYDTVSGAALDTDNSTGVSAKELQAALSDSSKTTVNLTGATLDADVATTNKFTISQTKTVNFAGATIKNLAINTESTGTVIVKNLTVTENVDIYAPNANVVFDDVNVTGTITISSALKSVTVKASTANVTIGKIVVNDFGHDIGLLGEVSGAYTITVNNIVNNLSGTLTIDPMTITNLFQKTAGTLVLKAITVATLNVQAAARISMDATTAVTTLNVKKDVTIAFYENLNGSNNPTVNKNVEYAADDTPTLAGGANDGVVIDDVVKAEGNNANAGADISALNGLFKAAGGTAYKGIAASGSAISGSAISGFAKADIDSYKAKYDALSADAKAILEEGVATSLTAWAALSAKIDSAATAAQKIGKTASSYTDGDAVKSAIAEQLTTAGITGVTVNADSATGNAGANTITLIATSGAGNEQRTIEHAITITLQ